jgi:manganese transport protein
MPHNLFLHSVVIQSRQWHLEDEKVIRRQMDYELFDTLFSMIIGWAINSAMILLAASSFYAHKVPVNELQQSKDILQPLLGNNAGNVFAIALLFAGLASAITSGMAGGSIFSGLFGEPYDIHDSHSRLGVIISLVFALLILFLIRDPYRGLIFSQMALSIQLPFTVFLQIWLTSSKKVMGRYVNKKRITAILLAIGIIIAYLNIKLLISFL